MQNTTKIKVQIQTSECKWSCWSHLKLCHSSLSYLDHWASSLEFHRQTHCHLNTSPIPRLLFPSYILMQFNKKIRLEYNIEKSPLIPLLLHPLHGHLSHLPTWIYQYFRGVGFCLPLKFTQRDVVPLITECGSPEEDLEGTFSSFPTVLGSLETLVLTADVGRVSSSKI